MAEDVIDAGVSEDISQQQQADGDKTTIAQGEVKTNGHDKSEVKTEAKVEDKAEKAYWPDDWRQKIAEHYGSGNPKAVEKELRGLESINDPAGLFAHMRGMENTWATKSFIKVPGKDAKPEELAEYHKALGVPEKPEGYMENLKFDDGLILGDEDKPMAEDFAKSVAHEAGMTPNQMQKAVGWYLKQQQDQAYALDDQDDKQQAESRKALQEEYGPTYKRLVNNVASVFQKAPGGTDIKNAESVYARVLGGRTADGKIIGNDPDIVRWLIGLAQEVNPAASVIEDGDLTGQSVDDKIAEIEKFMNTDRRAYFKDEKKQADYRGLLDARSKIRAKA